MNYFYFLLVLSLIIFACDSPTKDSNEKSKDSLELQDSSQDSSQDTSEIPEPDITL